MRAQSGDPNQFQEGKFHKQAMDKKEGDFMNKGKARVIKEILGLADKTVVEDINGVVTKVEKAVVNKPGSRDATRQRILVKDNTGAISVLVWGGNYTDDIIGKTITIKSAMVSEFQGKKRLTAFDRNIGIDKSAKISRLSESSKKYASIKEKGGQDYIGKDKIIFDLSRILVKCFDAVYKELKKEKYDDVPVQEVEKMAATIFLTIKEMLFAKWGKNAPAKNLEDLI